jgi:S-methylmethionine-dependent homocysteine/selenocysteine methylase
MAIPKKKCKKGLIHHQCSVSKSNTFISSETFQLEVSKSMTTISNTEIKEVCSAHFNYSAEFRDKQLKDLLDYLIVHVGPYTSTNDKNYRWNYLDEEDRINDKIGIEIFPMKIKIHWENNIDYSNEKILNKLNRLSNEVCNLISLK